MDSDVTRCHRECDSVLFLRAVVFVKWKMELLHAPQDALTQTHIRASREIKLVSARVERNRSNCRSGKPFLQSEMRLVVSPMDILIGIARAYSRFPRPIARRNLIVIFIILMMNNHLSWFMKPTPLVSSIIHALVNITERLKHRIISREEQTSPLVFLSIFANLSSRRLLV